MIDWLIHTDIQVFLFLNKIHSPVWDKIMWFISGKFSWIPLYLFILYLLIKKYRENIWIILLAIILVVALADQLSVNLFKNVFERLRPCHNPAIKDYVHIVNNDCGGYYGFVSSHAANTFAVACFTLLVIKNNTFTWFIFFWACLVSYSRIYLGRHYPLDIIGGAILGITIGYLVNIIMNYLIHRFKKKSSESC